MQTDIVVSVLCTAFVFLVIAASHSVLTSKWFREYRIARLTKSRDYLQARHDDYKHIVNELLGLPHSIENPEPSQAEITAIGHVLRQITHLSEEINYINKKIARINKKMSE